MHDDSGADSIEGWGGTRSGSWLEGWGGDILPTKDDIAEGVGG